MTTGIPHTLLCMTRANNYLDKWDHTNEDNPDFEDITTRVSVARYYMVRQHDVPYICRGFPSLPNGSKRSNGSTDVRKCCRASGSSLCLRGVMEGSHLCLQSSSAVEVPTPCGEYSLNTQSTRRGCEHSVKAHRLSAPGQNLQLTDLTPRL